MHKGPNTVYGSHGRIHNPTAHKLALTITPVFAVGTPAIPRSFKGWVRPSLLVYPRPHRDFDSEAEIVVELWIKLPPAGTPLEDLICQHDYL